MSGVFGNFREEKGETLARSIIVHALALAIATRLALIGLAWLGLRALPRLPLYPEQLPDSFLPARPALDGWARWDAAHYIAVAQFGYGDPASPSPNGGLGFFPVFPLLMRGLVELVRAEPTSGALAVAGWIIALTCFLGGVTLFAKLSGELLPAATARLATTLLIVSPFGLFFSAVYTESLFLLQGTAAALLARRERWWLAAIVAGTAAGTRLVGISIAAALLVAAWRARARLVELAGIAVIGTSGFWGFLLYTWWRFDDPLAYFETQERWGGWSEHVWFYVELFLTRPREALGGDPRHLVIMLNVALALLALALLPAVRRVADPTTVTLTALLVVGQTAITWVSLGRYLTPAFGLYLGGAVLLTGTRCPAWLRDTVVITGALLLATLTLLYTHGFWVI